MRPFEFVRPDTLNAAILAASQGSASADHRFLAGGTTLLDLMKLDVMRPTRVIDISRLRPGETSAIEVGPAGLRLGALVRMSDAAAHPEVQRNYPVIAQSLQLAASQ